MPRILPVFQDNNVIDKTTNDKGVVVGENMLSPNTSHPKYVINKLKKAPNPVNNPRSNKIPEINAITVQDNKAGTGVKIAH
jgi:hypothetical protein